MFGTRILTPFSISYTIILPIDLEAGRQAHNAALTFSSSNSPGACSNSTRYSWSSRATVLFHSCHLRMLSDKLAWSLSVSSLLVRRVAYWPYFGTGSTCPILSLSVASASTHVMEVATSSVAEGKTSRRNSTGLLTTWPGIARVWMSISE